MGRSQTGEGNLGSHTLGSGIVDSDLTSFFFLKKSVFSPLLCVFFHTLGANSAAAFRIGRDSRNAVWPRLHYLKRAMESLLWGDLIGGGWFFFVFEIGRFVEGSV